SNGEGADRPEVLAQASNRSEVPGDIEERRQNDQKDDVGVDLDARDARHESEHQPTDDEKDRIGDPETARDGDERRHRNGKAQDELGLVHGPSASYSSSPRGTHAAGSIRRLTAAPTSKRGVGAAAARMTTSLPAIPTSYSTLSP